MPLNFPGPAYPRIGSLRASICKRRGGVSSGIKWATRPGASLGSRGAPEAPGSAREAPANARERAPGRCQRMPGSARERMGAPGKRPGSARERCKRRGARGSARERPGAPGRSPPGSARNARERPGAPGSARERPRTPGSARERPGGRFIDNQMVGPCLGGPKRVHIRGSYPSGLGCSLLERIAGSAQAAHM